MKRLKQIQIPEWAWLLLALMLAAGVKVLLLWADSLPFNADEAVVALMARHIALGREFPVFFYGQAYMGSLDALLAAIGFRIFGEQVWVIRAIQTLLYLGTMGVVFAITRRIYADSPRTALWTVFLLAVPTVNVTLYTTISLGGYGEALLLGCLAIWGALVLRTRLLRAAPIPFWGWLLWGAGIGLGFWAFALSLVFALPAGVYVLLALWGAPANRPLRLLRAALLFLAGFLLGAAPWFWFAYQHGFEILLRELTLGGVAGVSGVSPLLRPFVHAFNFLLLGMTVIFGLRPPWDVRWLAAPLLPFALAFGLGVWVYAIRRARKTAEEALLLGVMLTLVALFIFSSFGVDPSGRYFVPLVVPLAIFSARWLTGLQKSIGRWVVLLLALLMLYNAWGTLQSALRYPPGITTQFDAVTQVDHRFMNELADFLRTHGETHGYTNYWVSYPLAFLTQEELVFVARLPYHQDFRYTPREDRYPPYAEQVARAKKIAYITTNNPPLDENLRAEFTRLGVTWQEHTIGNYQIFYALSQPVQPIVDGAFSALQLVIRDK
ncbi:MAG: hypothetical protein OHK0052_11400 [Anaerolineales bacterium]